MAAFMIIHGAWSAGWAWKKLRPRLRALGARVVHAHLHRLGRTRPPGAPEVGLDTHIDDMLAVLEYEDLHDVVLVGHSYGGMVATGVADRAAAQAAATGVSGRLRAANRAECLRPHPRDGARAQPGAGAQRRRGLAVAGQPLPPDTDAADDLAWCLPRRRMQPLRTFSTPVRLTGAVEALPRSYIYCTRSGPGRRIPAFRRQRENEPAVALLRARRQPQPAHHDAGHAGRAAASHRHVAGQDLERLL